MVRMEPVLTILTLGKESLWLKDILKRPLSNDKRVHAPENSTSDMKPKFDRIWTNWKIHNCHGIFQ